MEIEVMRKATILQRNIIVAMEKLQKVSDELIASQTEVIDRQSDLIKFMIKKEEE